MQEPTLRTNSVKSFPRDQRTNSVQGLSVANSHFGERVFAIELSAKICTLKIGSAQNHSL